MIDVNKPLENPVLKELFSRIGKNQKSDLELQNKILDEIIMRAYFLSHVFFDKPIETDETGKGTVKEDSNVSFYMISSSDGKQFYPAFTDWEELNKWNIGIDKIQTLILSFDDYAEMVLLNPDIEGFVINPFTTSFTFTREQLKILKKEKEERLKVVETKVEKDTPVMIGEAKEYPEDMLEALKSACKLDKNIKRTWLMLMYKEGQESYLLVVDSMGNEKESIEFIGRKVTPCLNGKYIDMLSYKDSFGKDVVKDKKPFYEKKNSI